MKYIFYSHLYNKKKWHIWLTFFMVIMVLTLILVAGVDVFLKGEDSTDYLIADLIASVLLASIVVWLTINYHRLLMHLVVLHDITERKQIENELWFTRTVIDMSKSAFYRFSPKGQVQYVSDFACKSLGYNRDELVGMYVWDFNPSIPVTAWPDLWDTLKSNKTVNLESDHKRKDGTIFSVDITGHQIYYNGEEFNIVFVQDITERKITEAVLSKQERYQHALFNNFPFAVWLKDTQSHFLAVNQVFAKVFGIQDAEQLSGKSDYDITSSSLAEGYRADDHDVMTSRERKIIEEEVEAQGVRKWVETFKAPVTDDSGEMLGTVGFFHDITERKIIEADLRVAAIAFESQEGIFITDAKSVILKVNQAFTNITGYSADEAIGQKSCMLKSAHHDEVFYAEIYESIDRLGFWRGEIWNSLKNGKVCPEYMSITAVTDNSGLVTNYVATLTDISEYKQAEEKRRADETRLRDVLVREVHHRIKNNLQGVTGILRNFVDKHPQFGVQITDAISQVESIAVIHGLQGRVAQTCVRLCELIKEIAANNESLWKTVISVDIPKHWIPCRIAETETVPLALVLNELIANAIKHSDSAKGINITLRHEPLPNMIQVTIKNSGRLPPDFDFPKTAVGAGLQLVASLLPKNGADLFWEQCDESVLVLLQLAPPIITMEQIEMVHHDEP